MNYKVSYFKKWDKEGTTFNQTITATLTRSELIGLNSFIIECKKEDTAHAIYLKPLQPGTNYAYLSQSKAFREYFNLSEDKRIKGDRNTIIKIKKICK